MRKRKHVQIGHVPLVVEDVQITGAGAVLLFANTAQTVLNDVQVAEQLLRRQAGAKDKHRVYEGVLIFQVRWLAFVETGNVDNLRIGQKAHIGDGLAEHGLLALKLFAFICHQRHIAAKADDRVRTQVLLQGFLGKRHIMRADNRSAKLASHQGLSSRCGIALLRLVDVIGIANIAFARNGNHGGITQVNQLLEIAHKLNGLLRSFAEPRARIEADSLVSDAGSLQLSCALGQVIAYLRNHVVVLGLVLHGARIVAEHVHYHQAGIAGLGNLDHGCIAESRHIVDDACSGLNRSLGNLSVAGVDAYADILFSQALYHLNGAGKLFLDGNGACAGARRLAAYIDDKRAFLAHLLGSGNCLFRVGVRAAIGKRVGSHV